MQFPIRLPREPGDTGPLYRAALAVERDRDLASEMAEWEEAGHADGLADAVPPPSRNDT